MPLAASGHLHQRAQSGIRRFRQVFQAKRDDGAVLASQLRNISHRANRNNLQEGVDLRLASAFFEQSVNELEGNANAGKILVRISATLLVGIKNCVSRRDTFAFIRQVMVGDDYVETVVSRPVKWFMRANAAVNADGEFVTFGHRSFQRRLLNSITFSEPMRHMKAGLRAQQIQRAQQHGRAGCPVNVVVAVDKDRFARDRWPSANAVRPRSCRA